MAVVRALAPPPVVPSRLSRPRPPPRPQQMPSFVWVTLVRDMPLADQDFGKVRLAGCTDVADVSERACETFSHWGVNAGQVKLFSVTKAGKAPTSAEIEAALLLKPLSPFDTLADAGIGSGSCLLARIPPPPAAAPGASRRRAGSARAFAHRDPRPPFIPALL